MLIYNYIKLGIRSLIAQKSYTIINIVGLSVGVAATILIFLHAQYETVYNKEIPLYNQLYRCVEIQQAPGVGEQHVAVTMGPLAEALVNDFPEVEKATRLMFWGAKPIEYKNQSFDQDYVIYSDPEAVELFGIKLLYGNEEDALTDKHSIIMSENVAYKIFGNSEEAMGKTVRINDQNFTVTGIMQNQNKQTTTRIEVLIPISNMTDEYSWFRNWGSNSLDTYIRLKEGTDIAFLETKFPEFLNKYTDQDESDWPISLYLQPVGDIHLKSGHIKFQVQNFHQGDINMVLAFSVIAFLIILLACINFVNISIAQSVKRTKEVGIRKVMGAERANLMSQFLGESTIITLVSVLIALLLVYILLPFFNETFSMTIEMNFLSNPVFIVSLILIFFFVSLTAGVYPAIYLSRYNPVKVLKSGIDTKDSTSGLLTKGLVVFQFVISIGMIFSIAVTYDQYKYALNKDIGINYNDVAIIKLYNKNKEDNVNILKNELLKNPNIRQVAFVSDYNGVEGTQASVNVDDSAQTRISMRFGSIDYNFFDMMEVPIIAGRNFNREYAFDDSCSVIVNRAAVEYLQWKDPIGKAFRPFLDTVTNMKVIGVVEDYNYYSIHSKVEPALYMIRPDRSNLLVAKISRENKAATLAYMEEIWNNSFPDLPFNYRMAVDQVSKYYSNESNTFKLFGIFTILSLVISGLGLYGLTALIIERKIKEIGIRKVFGGSVFQITRMLLVNFVVLVVVAGIIATPLAYYLMVMSISNFAYHINISWIYFVEAILAAVLIALLTIIYHAVKAAVADPVETLRYE